MTRTIALLSVVLTLPLFAAGLGKHDRWSSSPAAYFMTAAEKAEWAKLQTEAEADAFIAKFIEARGGEKFTEELANRVQKADQYLTVGKTPGSQSLRGKVVVLFGPPAGMTVEAKPARAPGRTTSSPSTASEGEGNGAGTSIGELVDASLRQGMSRARDERLYTLTYPNITVVVEVNADTGKDRIADKKALPALEKAFDEAARASIVAK